MLTIQDFSKEGLLQILDEAIAFSEGKTAKVQGEVFVANLFFENSTRTKISFEVAERKLGMQVVPFEVEHSSVKKGETLYDTVKTLESIGIDLVVIRHSENEYWKNLQGIDIPIINGGDGTGNHPSQTMLDLLTIYQEFGKFQGLKVGICGDVKHSRVANSAAEALGKLGAEVYFSGPEEWFAGDLKNFRTIDELLPEVDVLMLLRIQHERHSEASGFSAED